MNAVNHTSFRRNKYHPAHRTWMHLGVNDGLQSKPFNPDYENAEPLAQKNYENGRLVGVGIRAAGLVVVPLRASEVGKATWPSRIVKAMHQVAVTVGATQPEHTRTEYLKQMKAAA